MKKIKYALLLAGSIVFLTSGSTLSEDGILHMLITALAVLSACAFLDEIVSKK